MMHMIKLCVGVATLEELEGYREERAHWWGADYGEDVHVHRTRIMPKRRAEIEGQGSIYWVISLFGLFVSASMMLVKRRHEANQREHDDMIHLDDHAMH